MRFVLALAAVACAATVKEDGPPVRVKGDDDFFGGSYDDDLDYDDDDLDLASWALYYDDHDYAMKGMTPLSHLEGVAWVAKTWTGSATKGGDPDPVADEAIITFSRDTIFFVNDGGGGPYKVTSLPAEVQSPDGEKITFWMNTEGQLVVDFAYSEHRGTIWYERLDDALRAIRDARNENERSGSNTVLVALATFIIGYYVGRSKKDRRARTTSTGTSATDRFKDAVLKGRKDLLWNVDDPVVVLQVDDPVDATPAD
mmetsp:Transcript_13609/g.40547  ORF Transcript_13609/g.40547 Transcript_13609/m.40547 type:complete len:256 (+) Transcript_13609:196-963(+)